MRIISARFNTDVDIPHLGLQKRFIESEKVTGVFDKKQNVLIIKSNNADQITIVPLSTIVFLKAPNE